MAQHPHSHNSQASDARQRVSAHYPHHHPQPRVYHTPYSSPLGYGSPLPPPSVRQGSHSGRYLLAGGSMLALAALVITPSMDSATSGANSGGRDVCIKQVNQQVLMSRDELKAVLDLPPQTPREKVQALVQQPYCVLETTAGEDGVQQEREAYPLEFDPQTWFVLLYRDGQYAGYDFSFR